MGNRTARRSTLHEELRGHGVELLRISANVTDDFGNVTGLEAMLDCAR